MKERELRCLYMQLGQHMWRGPMDTFSGKVRGDERMPYDEGARWVVEHWNRLKFDDGSWRRITDYAAKRGFNMIQLDLAEGVRYPSHPELAVDDSWSPDRVRDEVRRLAKMGIELMPSLNFSAAHDIWLGEYSRMLSTPEYYRVCSDIIADVCEMFGTPKLFSIGYDEESPRLQRNQNYCVCRQGELWWHDLLWLVSEVEKHGVRAQMAADYAWAHKDEYLKRAPRSVLQTNWYYGAEFDPAKMKHPEELLTYDELEKAGFDQFPGCSNHAYATNIGDTVRYCRKHIHPDRLKGFQVSIWRYTTPEYEQRHFDAIDQLADADVNAAHVRGSIAECARYESLHPRFSKAFAFMRRPDLADLPCGRYEIDGSNCWAMVQEVSLKPHADENKYEVHRAFIDIQTPITGSETIGVTAPEPKVFDGFNVEKDYGLFMAKGDLWTLKPGEFAIFFPETGAHAPGLSADGPRKIRKLVIKVRDSL